MDDIVCGLGNTVDYEIVWDDEVFQRIIDDYQINISEITQLSSISSERDLVRVIAAYMKTGTGGEHPVASSSIVERFASRFLFKTTLGGTGVRAGIALASLGIPTTQHLVSVNQSTRSLLPDSIRFISATVTEAIYPHLIVQYPKGARVQIAEEKIMAPQSNRLIFGDDPANRELLLSGELSKTLRKARAFLISGFNTMTDVDLLRQRLGDLLAAMTHLPKDALVYYEEAAFYRADFPGIVREKLLPKIEVYGMNEDELQGLLGRSVDLLDADQVAGALREAQTLIPVPVLVIHSRYWAIAIGGKAKNYGASLLSAVQMAGTRYRIGNGHSAKDFTDTGKFPLHPGGAKVVEQVQKMREIIGVPAYLIDTENAITVGLGDSFAGGFLAALA